METEDTLLTEPCKPVPVEMEISIGDFKTHLARVLSCVDTKKEDYCASVCLNESDIVGTNGSVLYKGTLPFSFPEQMTVRAADLLPILKWGTKRQSDYRLEVAITESAGKKALLFSFCGQTLCVPASNARYPVYSTLFRENEFQSVSVPEMSFSGPVLGSLLKTCENVKVCLKKDEKDVPFAFIDTLDSVKGIFIVAGLQD